MRKRMTKDEISDQLNTILSYYKDLKMRNPQFLDKEENEKDIEAMEYAVNCVKNS